jgi:hypothetical protein
MKLLFLKKSEYNATVAMSTAPVDSNVGDTDHVALVSRIKLPLDVCKGWLWIPSDSLSTLLQPT